MKTILQTVEFNTSPEVLFDIYLDSERHSEAIDARTSISQEVGGEFRAFDDGLKGRNLAIVPKRMIVQSWRASTWKEDDPDSILILLFHKTSKGAGIELVQAGVPDHTFDRINEGWQKYYWQPWKAYLEKVMPGAKV